MPREGVAASAGTAAGFFTTGRGYQIWHLDSDVGLSLIFGLKFHRDHPSNLPPANRPPASSRAQRPACWSCTPIGLSRAGK
ncbi:hypothetical protein FRAAL4750 [Frankia alni ACN14a]|uniref:Uncharacterized protein n=1 Tax=Frankia alni (strain DSM 45986 / CECT 9034 / ACN14a) TaxID=326424 RepID=Q0RGJ6_FRAAA|nr:hypothetical protein FRAAL4750 [Frankia alni ACN14a]